MIAENKGQPADNAYKQFTLKTTNKMRLRRFVVETDANLNQANEYIKFALRSEKAAAIGTPVTKGTIVWDQVFIGVAASVKNTGRYEYDLNKRILELDEDKDELWVDWHHAIGAACNVRFELQYDKIENA